MPSNIAQLKKELNKEFKKYRGGPVQRLAASKIAERLAINTPIRTGQLNGGNVASVSSFRTTPGPIVLNKGRFTPSTTRATIETLNGTKTFFMTNSVPYAVNVNLRRKFFEMTVLEVTQFLRSKGIKVTVS